MYKPKPHHECKMPARAKLIVLALNASLKHEPEISNTDELTREVIANMGTSCEITSPSRSTLRIPLSGRDEP